MTVSSCNNAPLFSTFSTWATTHLHHDHESRHVVEQRRQESVLVVLQKPLLVLRQRLVAVQQVLDVAVHSDQLPLARDHVCGQQKDF